LLGYLDPLAQSLKDVFPFRLDLVEDRTQST
jgi:hypothetical protein